MNKKIILIIVIFSFIISTLYSLSDNADPDRLITEIYVKNSYKQFESDNFEEALSLSDIALSFSKDNSDALYIKSLSSRNLGLISAWKEDLAAAIIFNNWNYYNEIYARIGLSQFMFLDGNIEEAYLNLRPFRNELSNNPKFTELFIRISLSVGNVEEALSIAGNHLEVNPYDNYSQLIMAMYDPDWINKAEKILVEGDPSNYISKKVLQHIINNRSDCKYLNDLYLNRWGADRFYRISNACEKTVNLSEILSELFPDNIKVNFSELTKIYNLFEDENNRQKIINWLSAISLTVLYDTDGDGFNDTEAFYNKSNLKFFNYDSNHDNNFDYFVELDQVPVKLDIITKTGTEKYSYKDYPYLINIVKSSGQTLEEYQLIPYNLSFEIISIPKDFTREMPFILENLSFPDNDILTLSSTLKTIKDIGENTISNYSIIGLDESVEKIINADGVKILERHYKKSILITVFKDFDSDGVFDTIYDYKDGILKTVSFDENNNGISEYIENYENGLVSSWDFNEDGVIDSREKIKNGIIYRELSSKLDGIFDTTLEITSDME